MPPTEPTPEPSRPKDLARLALTRLRVQDGVTLKTIIRNVTETAAQVLQVERASVWLLVDQRRTLRCVDLFELSKGTHSAGITFRVDDFPEYFAALDRRKTLPAELAVTDPRTCGLVDAYLEPLGISSLLDAAIFVGGDLIGVVCHEHIGPHREWTTEERDFAGSMADVLALKIRTAELEEARLVMRVQATQIAESRRLDSLAEMAAGIAHDFNNILSVVISDAGLIANRPDSHPETVEIARRIQSVGWAGAALSKDLMSFARPGANSSRVHRPAELVTAQQPLLQAAAGDQHPIELNVHSTAGRVLIAAEHLERLVLNLVINARDASPRGGPISITVDATESQDDDGQSGHYLRITVADQGEGISPELLPKIFDPFFSTKGQGVGTGLGLTVVDQIVKYAGGFIRVDSAVGKGSRFQVYLPRVSSQS